MMVFRTMLVAALMAAPMVTPADASAQDRGANRSEAAAVNQEAGNRPDAAPEGLERAFDNRTPPAGLERRFPGLFSEPEPEPDLAPTAEPASADDCDTSLELVGTEYVLVDCEGNVADPLE